MNYKKFGVLFLILSSLLLLGFGLTIVIIDPYFHYHKPLVNYELNNQRYQNDGIVKHFDYDALITGTSMTENFKTSELDALFDLHSVKVSLSGATYKEESRLVAAALKHNSNLKYIIWGIDYSRFYDDKDAMAYENYPEYLYNKNLFDDVKYIFNKDVFLTSLGLLKNKIVTSFDEYSFWESQYTFGKDVLDAIYNRPIKVETEYEINDEDIKKLKDNIEQNIISVVSQYPDTEFYLFYPPYSIYQWDNDHQLGILNKILIGEKTITEMLLSYDNVHIFSFLDNHKIIENLDLYKDTIHYASSVNSYILKSMHSQEHELTKENYLHYYDEIMTYYDKYNYDKLFEAK